MGGKGGRLDIRKKCFQDTPDLEGRGVFQLEKKEGENAPAHQTNS